MRGSLVAAGVGGLMAFVVAWLLLNIMAVRP